MNGLAIIESELLVDMDIEGLGSIYPTKPEDVSNALATAESNLRRVSKATQIFRHHSDVTWDAHIINNDSIIGDISQLSAELKKKRDALIEAKHEYKERKMKVAALREKARFTDSDRQAKRAQIHAEADKWEAYAKMMLEAVFMATKDVNKLTSRYVEIEKIIIEKHGKFDEEIVEKIEREDWPKRLIRQSMRDVRQNNVISKGEQEALENIGLDPLVVQSYIRVFISAQKKDIENGEAGFSSETLDDFIKKCGEKFQYAHDEKLKRKGLSHEIQKEHLFIEETL